MRRALAIAVVCAAGAAASAQTMYSIRQATQDDDILVAIDISNPDNPEVYDIGPIGQPFEYGGMTFGPGGELFMIGGGASESLYTVDTDTGAATLVGDHDVPWLLAVAWDSTNERMFATQFAGGSGLYELDPITGEARVINSSMANGIGGLAYNFDTDQLVGSQDGSAGDLWEIDRDDGSQTLLYDGVFINDSGLVYDSTNNYFWAIDGYGDLYYYDIDAGYERVHVLDGLGWHNGLALAPSDDPGCPADMDGDGDADVGDFFLYLDLFAAGDMAADITGDGNIDVGDFFAYLDLFAQGC